MSLQQYEIIDEIAKAQNFAKAAEKLNMSPSAVSHAVAALEDELGFSLFFRSRTRVALTKEGERMLVHIRSILQQERAMREESTEIRGLARGTVTIGTFSSVCLSWIPDILKTFREAYPDIRTEVLQGDYGDVLEWVKNGIVDIGFETLPTPEKVTERPLYRDRLIWVTPKDYVAKTKEAVTESDLERYSLILQRSGYDTDTMHFLEKRKLKYHSDYRVDDDHAILEFVQRGLGISLMAELILKKIQADVQVFPVYPEESRVIGLITQNKVPLSPAAGKMYEHIIDWVKNNVEGALE